MDMYGPETFVVALITLVFWLPPVLAGVWALVTLHRIRQMQASLGGQLDRIERLLEHP
jgi:hypothetical protein